MNSAFIEYRQRLLANSARLDQMLAEADAILAAPVTSRSDAGPKTCERQSWR